jgi:pilus assembly protein FimV
MNRIKTGKILRMPEQNELTGISQGEAVKQIHAQVADWNAYRQKLAGAASVSGQPQAAQPVSSGKITSSVVDKAPVAKESAKEVLKLSKGEAPGDKTGAGGKAMSAQDKKNAAQEEVIAKAKALKEEQGRAALLEKNLKDMQRLAELKAQAAALTLAASKQASAVVVASQVVAASQVAAVSQVAAASSVAAASAVKPAPVAKPKPVVVSQPSLLDQILGEPLYLAGGAAALLGLVGLGFVAYRRKKSAAADETHAAEEIGSTTGHMTTPVVPSPETGDFTAAAVSDAADEQRDEVDPISEADLFLNFGRDAQAEEILKEALQNTPSDHRIHLKLLGIYAKRQDVNSFAELAGGLQDSGDDEAWQQAAEMGRKLDPNNPMYGGVATIEDAESATMQTTALNAIPDVLDETPEPQAAATEIDFDLGASAEEAASPEQSFMESAEQRTVVMSAEDMAAAKAETMDFDVTSTSPSLSAPTSMDFDITSTSPSMPAASESAALPNLDDLIFDVTSTQPAMPAAEPSKPAPADDGGMEFTLDFPIGEAAEKPAAQPEVALSEISLNLDEVSPEEPASAAKDEHWHEVATKLDLAKAYQEMGDQTGAREILDEVMQEGDAEQREAAQALLDQLV